MGVELTCNLAAYHFVTVDDPAALARAMRAECEARDLLGTVLVAGEGINVFLAGNEAQVRGFLAWLRSDSRFAAIAIKLSYSDAIPFARLKVKLKREIIAFRREDADPVASRAPSVSARQLHRWMSQGGVDDDGRRVVLLDTRNREEVGHGSFEAAITLPIDNFVDFPVAASALREQIGDATVVPFCTGGIRCEKAALWMQSAGFDHVRQLEGGILGYFEQVGGEHYRGGCFVFDQRVALDPRLVPVDG